MTPSLGTRTRYPPCVNLSESELLEHIAEGEGRGLEFKRGLPRDEKLARTLCAFANTRGGMLFVGVEDNGSLYGVSRPREIMARIRGVARELITPPLELATTHVRCGDLSVVAARVAVSRERPHAVRRDGVEDEIVVRVGASNRRAKGATLDALRSGRGQRRSPDALEARILSWVDQRRLAGRDPAGDASPQAFSRANNIGLQRARRAFVRLERDGLLVGHGLGNKRVYCRP